MGKGLVRLPTSVNVGWTTPRQLDAAGRTTGDPLGFRAAAARWTGQLVPVVTRSCCRVRQLSVFSMALKVSGGSSSAGREARERFMRLERLWVLAYRRDREPGADGSAVFAGVQAAESRLLGDGPVDIATPLLAAQLTSGLWGQCRRPAYQVGLITGRGGGPEGWRLTQRGTELAAAAEYALDCAATPGHAVRQEEVTRDRLLKLFPFAGDTTEHGSDEALCIGEALWRYDQLPGNDGEFAALYESLEAFGGLATTMPPEHLNPDQARALRVVDAVVSLAEAVEGPYRDHLRGKVGRLPKRVGHHPGWKVLAEVGERELADLGSRLALNPSMRVVQAHHERLAASRGSLPWTRHSVDTDVDKVRPFEQVETRLEAVQMLFEDGAVPEAQ